MSKKTIVNIAQPLRLKLAYDRIICTTARNKRMEKEEKLMYKVLKQEGRAKRARMETVHGTIETPVFMNVGTAAAIKGAVSTMDLQEIKTQVELSNTYHLHVRPGDKVVKQLGGLQVFSGAGIYALYQN